MILFTILGGTASGKSSTMKALMARLGKDTPKLEPLKTASLIPITGTKIYMHYFADADVGIIGDYSRKSGAGGMESLGWDVKIPDVLKLYPCPLVGFEGFMYSTSFGAFGQWLTENPLGLRTVPFLLATRPEIALQRMTGRRAAFRGGHSTDMLPRISSSGRAAISCFKRWKAIPSTIGAFEVPLDLDADGRALWILTELSKLAQFEFNSDKTSPVPL